MYWRKGRINKDFLRKSFVEKLYKASAIVEINATDAISPTIGDLTATGTITQLRWQCDAKRQGDGSFVLTTPETRGR